MSKGLTAINANNATLFPHFCACNYQNRQKHQREETENRCTQLETKIHNVVEDCRKLDRAIAIIKDDRDAMTVNVCADRCASVRCYREPSGKPASKEFNNPCTGGSESKRGVNKGNKPQQHICAASSSHKETSCRAEQSSPRDTAAARYTGTASMNFNVSSAPAAKPDVVPVVCSHLQRSDKNVRGKSAGARGTGSVGHRRDVAGAAKVDSKNDVAFFRGLQPTSNNAGDAGSAHVQKDPRESTEKSPFTAFIVDPQPSEKRLNVQKTGQRHMRPYQPGTAPTTTRGNACVATNGDPQQPSHIDKDLETRNAEKLVADEVLQEQAEVTENAVKISSAVPLSSQPQSSDKENLMEAVGEAQTAASINLPQESAVLKHPSDFFITVRNRTRHRPSKKKPLHSKPTGGVREVTSKAERKDVVLRPRFASRVTFRCPPDRT